MNYFPAAVASVLVLASSAMAADNVAKQLDSNYAAMSAAFKKKDIKVFGKFYASNFVGTQSNGIKQNRTQLLAQLQKQMNTAKDVTLERKVSKLVMKGSQAVATLDAQFKGRMKLGDGKEHQVEQKSKLENVWAKSGKDWVMVSAKLLTSSVSVDGRKVEPGSGRSGPLKPTKV